MNHAKIDRGGTPLSEIIWFIGRPLLLLFRWPFAPLWMRDDGWHDSQNLSVVAERRFVVMCFVAAIVEIGTMGLFIASYFGIASMLYPAIILGLTFILMSCFRCLIWVVNVEF